MEFCGKQPKKVADLPKSLPTKGWLVRLQLLKSPIRCKELPQKIEEPLEKVEENKTVRDKEGGKQDSKRQRRRETSDFESH